MYIVLLYKPLYYYGCKILFSNTIVEKESLNNIPSYADYVDLHAHKHRVIRIRHLGHKTFDPWGVPQSRSLSIQFRCSPDACWRSQHHGAAQWTPDVSYCLRGFLSFWQITCTARQTGLSCQLLPGWQIRKDKVSNVYNKQNSISDFSPAQKTHFWSIRLIRLVLLILN